MKRDYNVVPIHCHSHGVVVLHVLGRSRTNRKVVACSQQFSLLQRKKKKLFIFKKKIDVRESASIIY